MSKNISRSEVPVEQTWDLKDLFATESEYEQSLEELKILVDAFTKYKGQLCNSGQTLKNALDEYAVIYKSIIRAAVYGNLKQSEDGSNPENQSRSMKNGALFSELQSKITFFESEILDLEEEAYKQLFVDEPQLSAHKYYLDKLYKEKKYRLSSETEEILAALGSTHSAPYRIYVTSKSSDMVFDAIEDGKGQTHQNSFVLFENLYEASTDTTLRRNAYASFCKTLNQYKNTYAAVYGTEVNKQVIMSRVRGYESVSHMLLQDQEISFDMYNNQVQLIYTKLAPHMRKFAQLKKEQLGLEEMRFCDLKTPLDVDFAPPATYDEIKNLIVEALSVLGDDYKKIIETAFENRWIDYANNSGKSTGAFCSSPYGVHPYILISYEENMRLAFTLAHELGHAGHFQLAMNEQSIFDLRPSTYFVEAPSTLNEMLLAEHLKKKYDSPQMKRWVILQLLGTYYHNFVTHLLEAEFQRRVYSYAESGNPLTAQYLCSTKLDVIRTFWGDSVVVDEDAGLTWMRQPHYYMGLYPYTYSAGLSASTAIAKQIFSEGQPAIDRWLNTLKLGGSMAPHDLLKCAGIDMTTPEPIESAVQYVGALIDELITLY